MNTITNHNRHRDLFRDVFAPFFTTALDTSFDNDFERKWNDFVPSTDIKENDKEVVITLSLAGFTKNDVEIDVKDNLLTIKGEKQEESESTEETYHRKEISTGSFKRSFQLDNRKDLKKIDARFENGLLIIHIPKKEEDLAMKVSIK